jgi:hypothetical protein
MKSELSLFQKSFEGIQVSLNQTSLAVLYMKTDIHLWQYLAQFFLEWEIFRKMIVKKVKNTFYDQYIFFEKIVRFVR